MVSYKIRAVFFSVLTAIMLSMPAVSSQPPNNPVQKKKVDFAVESIYSEKCACELQGVDAFYVNKIILRISNRSGMTEDAEIVIAYFDYYNYRNRSIVKRAIALKPGETRAITMMRMPAIIQKSVGVTGIISPVYPTFVEDINKQNDRITIHECRSSKSR